MAIYSFLLNICARPLETRAGSKYEYAVEIAGQRKVLRTIDMSVNVRFRLTFSGSGVDFVRI